MKGQEEQIAPLPRLDIGVGWPDGWAKRRLFRWEIVGWWAHATNIADRKRFRECLPDLECYSGVFRSSNSSR